MLSLACLGWKSDRFCKKIAHGSRKGVFHTVAPPVRFHQNSAGLCADRLPKSSFPSTFPTFVTSLSWENGHFYVKPAQSRAFSAPGSSSSEDTSSGIMPLACSNNALFVSDTLRSRITRPVCAVIGHITAPGPCGSATATILSMSCCLKRRPPPSSSRPLHAGEESEKFQKLN